MKEFNNLSFKLSKKITEAYSTSFSLGIKVFSKEYREPIYAIYAFVRLADEIVDTFHNFDKHYLMDKFRKDTFEAIEMRISTNTVLNSFQKVVHDYNIDLSLIDAFLKSMEMDLSHSSYEKHQFDKYVFGSAEVVGLMCLHVFCKGDKALYEELKYPAQQLGSAFQKVNFLRDIKSDLLERGRIYLPNVNQPINIDDENKAILEEEIEKEFNEALKGIKKLPLGVKLGVYSA
ncbi:MAG: phytoene/squalene synthase family protein, partial [Ignavibacteria bacterium]|nr:phytoene/squalene synthase family protein [Ignavibacteria bacterium]